MGKRIADQHEVMNRGWEEADKLAQALRDSARDVSPRRIRRANAEAVIRRYEEARES